MHYSKLKYPSIYILLIIIFFSTTNSFSQNDGNPTFKLGSDTCFVPFEEMEIDCLCIPQNSYMIIESDSILTNMIQENQRNPDCVDYFPDKIDLKKEVLVGFCARNGGCARPEIEISVYKIDSLKKMECNVNIIRKGNCLAMFYKVIWIKFDKPESDFTIKILDVKNKLTERKSCYE